MDKDKLVAMLKVEAQGNDGKISKDESAIINYTEENYNPDGSPAKFYERLFREAKRDGMIEEDEGDLLKVAADALGLKINERYEWVPIGDEHI